eukprot:15479751-Alexandrium_andersonii.AAC.1
MCIRDRCAPRTLGQGRGRFGTCGREQGVWACPTASTRGSSTASGARSATRSSGGSWPRQRTVAPAAAAPPVPDGGGAAPGILRPPPAPAGAGG